VAGFTWPAWILSDATYPRRGATTPDGGNLWYADAQRPMDLMDLGGGRAALLVREGDLLNTPHALVVFLRKDQARVLQAPAGFQLGQYSRMAWSPDGQALAVSEHEGRRVWVVKPERIAADEPTKTTGPAGTEVF